ncbi:hypothetical protein MMC17_003620 [Xylographa soralifera]|nr:hypothetical protein [Xylographa soralifera]
MAASPNAQGCDDVEQKTPTRKRRRGAPTSTSRDSPIDLTNEDDDPLEISAKKRKTASPRKGKDEEKRMKMFRKHPPQSYLEKLNRALEQRMFVLGRERKGTEEAPEETIEMAGSTGNIYNVSINKLPSCTCPDNRKGNQCKHIVYVLHNVLKAPEELQYQLAFLSSELRDIFSRAPVSPSSQDSAKEADPDHPSNRKAIDGDCPICFTELDAEDKSIVFCRAACGNNLHRECFEQWARSQAGKTVTCVYCRTPWQGDQTSIKNVKGKREINDEGYVNIATELGLSGTRGKLFPFYLLTIAVLTQRLHRLFYVPPAMGPSKV